MQSNPKRKRESGIRGVESLETRSLLSGSPLVVPGDVDAADTLDQATQLGVLTAAEIHGSIDQAGADVDWFAFTLQFPSTVTLTGAGGTFGLYDAVDSPINDPFGNVGHRLLSQSTSDGASPATLTRDLAAGTYYVAVSGIGNTHFHPLLAHSGFPGQAGDYVVELSSTQIDTSVSTDPLVLSADASALGLQIDLSDALDFAPTVTLFADDGTPVAVGSVQQNEATNDLIIVPSSALSPGHYRAEVSDPSGNARLTVEFDVPAGSGSEADKGNDTPATAEELGEVAGAGLVQVTGIIGDDPYYQLLNSNQNLFAGNDVDLYHFHVDATGTVGLQAEVFAGRIGSRLDAGLTLYRWNPVTGSLEFVSGNNNSINPLILEDGSQPLFFDPVVIAGVTAGDYYLAVSHGLNAVSPLERHGPGQSAGVLDPTQSHSATNGTGVGQYVLNVQVVPLGDQPRVTEVSIDDGEDLSSAPTVITVRFSDFVNLTSAAYASIVTTHEGVIPGVFIQNGKGEILHPVLVSFNPQTFEASFVMQRRLSPDNYELHLSGKLGVADLAGNPLEGNSSSGDYVVDFKVRRNSVGTNGNPQLWMHDPATDETGAPQQLGALFPVELLTGVEIDRPTGKSKGKAFDFSDAYQFQALMNATYVIRLNGLLAGGLRLTLTDSSGNAVEVFTDDDSRTLYTRLEPGEYTVNVSTRSGILVPVLGYHVTILQLDVHDNAPPLSVGPAPTVGMKLSGMSDPITGGGGSNPGTGPTGPGRVPSRPGSVDVGVGGAVINSATNPNSPNYLPLRNGLPRLNLADGQQNVIIAIPTVTNQTGTTSGMIFRAARAGRVGLAEREVLAPRGLSSLADGPIGRTNGLGGLLNRSDAGSLSLQALIQSSIANERNVAADNAAESQDKQASNSNETPVDENGDDAASDAITASEHPANIDAGQSGSRKVTKRDPGFLLDAISMLYDGRVPVAMRTDTVSQTTTSDEDWNAEPTLIVSAEEYSSVGGTSQAARSNEAEAAGDLADQLFGVGLGLLLTGLFLPRTANKVAKSGGHFHRPSSRRAAKLCELGEDSGA